jgi:hypothetical protein
MPGQIPTSNALSEADPRESLAELLSRNPEDYQNQDLDRVIDVMRDLRERYLKATDGGRNTSRAAKSAAHQSISATSAEDLT